jgi:hypothetical protein
MVPPTDPRRLGVWVGPTAGCHDHRGEDADDLDAAVGFLRLLLSKEKEIL